MHGKKKHLDFEVNLVPFIDLLSVCICFLLLTAVWVNVGSMNVKQAVGGQSVAETEKKPVLWVFIGKNGELTLETRDSARVSGRLAKFALAPATAGSLPALQDVEAFVGQLKAIEPDLRTVLIQPQADTAYESIIDLMDQFKKSGLNDLGVVPL